MSKKSKNKFFAPVIGPSETTNKFATSKIGHNDMKPVFSFSYYFDENRDWSFRCVRDSTKFHDLFKNLMNMSKLTWGVIKVNKQFHAHEVDDIDRLPACVHSHFKRMKLYELPPFQFKAFDESRVIGVFTNAAVFEVVCLDHNHSMYPRGH